MATDDFRPGDDTGGDGTYRPPSDRERRSDGERRSGRDAGDDTDSFPAADPYPDTESIPTYRVGRSSYAGGAYASGSYGTAYEDVVEFDDMEIAGLDAPVRTTVQYESSSMERVDFIATKDPSDLVRRYLYPTEKFRGEWRRHWIHLFRRVGIGVLATFILGYIAGYFVKANLPSALTVLVAVWIGVIIWVLWAVVEWYFDRFILTNKRIMLVEGIIARRVAMMPLARVTDMKYTQSPMGRVLSYGTFEIESAGQDQALRNVVNLPNPTDLYLQVVEEMYEPEASEARRRAVKADDGM